MTQPHSRVVGVVLHQGVVMCGEEGATADLLSKLPHNSTGNRCAIVCGCAPSCKQFTAVWLQPQTYSAEETAYDIHSNYE